MKFYGSRKGTVFWDQQLHKDLLPEMEKKQFQEGRIPMVVEGTLENTEAGWIQLHIGRKI